MWCGKKFLVSLLMTAWLSFTSANATIIPSLDLPALVRDANLIVVGTVESVWEEGRISINIQGHTVRARRRVARLHVDRVLKGQSSQSSISFRFLIPELPLGYRGITAPQFGMFFLRENSPQEYVVLDPYHPFVVASPDVPTAIEGDDLDKVIANIARILTTPRASYNEREQAITMLANVDIPLTTTLLRCAAQELDKPLRLMAVGVLLSRNDISGLNLAEEALLKSPPDIDEKVLRRLAVALQNGVKDSQAIPVLSRLLSARDVYTRRAAASALRHTAVFAAVEPLSRALEDSDHQVRYYAVIGLAEITGQDEWGPSIDLFQEKEQYFLSHWREWARNR